MKYLKKLLLPILLLGFTLSGCSSRSEEHTSELQSQR